MLSAYFRLTKIGIVVFVLLSGMAGFALACEPGAPIDFGAFIGVLLGLYFVSSGSLALNQVHEVEADRRMRRTENRPIVTGEISKQSASWIAYGFLAVGVSFCFLVSLLSGIFSLATVILYNIFYTFWWKKRLIFAAVPGALPGAMPVAIGYAAATPEILNSELGYAFLIMFLWQMPHFWVLAMRYRDDYRGAGIPVLPAELGASRTLFHVGLYVFAYVALAVFSPWLTTAYWAYAFFVVPVSIKVLFEFYKYLLAEGQKGWLKFFLWTNASVLVFLLAPIIDKWHRHFLGFL